MIIKYKTKTMKKIATFLLVTMIGFTVFAQNARELLDKGKTSYENKKYEEAVKVFTKIINIKDRHFGNWSSVIESYERRAKIYSILGKYDLAEKDYQELVNVKSGENKARAYFTLAQFYDELGKQKERDLAYANIFKADSRSAFFRAQDFRIVAEKITNRRSQEFTNVEIATVLELYRKAILIDPFSVLNYANKAAFQTLIDRPHDALHTYEEFVGLPQNEIKSADKAEVFLYIGMIYFDQLKNENSGEEYFKKALALDYRSKYGISNYFRSIAQNLQGENLKKHLEKWAKFLPEDKANNYEFAKYYMAEKEFKKAIKYLDLVIDKSGIGDGEYFAARALAYDYLGRQENKMEYYQKSIEDWDKFPTVTFFKPTAEFYFYRAGTTYRLFKLKYEQEEKADLELAENITSDISKVLELDDKHAHAYETRANLNFILNGKKKNESIENDFAMHDKYCPSKQK